MRRYSILLTVGVGIVGFSALRLEGATLADSLAEWSTAGVQGAGGWFYGYYNFTLDANKVYEVNDFIQFQAQYWNGTQYDLLPDAAGPWTELGQETTHPNGTNSPPGQEQWTIRRWTSDFSGTAVLTWHMRKTNTGCGDGVGGKLFVNGALVDETAIGGSDGTGVTRTVVRAIAVGTRIDLALTPNGADGCDGSAFWLKVGDDLSQLPDGDSDGIFDAVDNCPAIANAGQANSDGDPLGDACDNCPSVSNANQADLNANGIGDACEDGDGDGVGDATDNCPQLPNLNQQDTDGDGVGNACDNCPSADNQYQADSDSDGLGDACDADSPDGLPGPWQVTINEIHYHPLEGEDLEFIELHNGSSAPVDVGLWYFLEGLSFRIPRNTSIPGQGYLVLCSNPASLSARYGLPVNSLIWWGSSSLDNGGENIVLVDPFGVIADKAFFDDDPPWDAAADGTGPSLQKLCPDADGNLPSSWAAAGAAPTPGAVNQVQQCPPPAPPVPAVAINELYYHPPDGLEASQEYVELVNTTGQTINLQGFSFSQGIDFTFTQSTPLAPGAFLAVCRDQASVRTAFGITNTAGNFTGQLSNEGERVTLIDPQGRVVDSVRYEDSGEWPVGVDGEGFSLEKIVASAPSDDPRNWLDSGAGDEVVQPGWQTATSTGTATSNRLYFYIEDAGEFLIDNVSLVDVANPGVNLLPAFGFTAGISPWTPIGNHIASRWSRDAGGEFFDEPALHLVAEGVGNGSANSVRVDTSQPLTLNGPAYRLSFSYLHLSGSASLVARLSQAQPGAGLYFRLQGGVAGKLTPGEANVVQSAAAPPMVSRISRWPIEPAASDTVWIRAHTRGNPTQVLLTANLAAGTQVFTLRDDGVSFDGEAGDGIFGVQLPAQPHNTGVTFTIEARTAGGTRTTPLRTDPMTRHGYYVTNNQPLTHLPVFNFLVPATDARGWLQSRGCSSYSIFSFAFKGDLHYNVGIRDRGGSVCGASKPYMKIRFHKGHELRYAGTFKGHKNLDLQSLWTDKALSRENLAWNVFREMDNAMVGHDYIRILTNGTYFALYAAMERPDERWLERNRLNPDGNLYKATASVEQRDGTYEKKTNEFESDADLRTFLNNMHDTPAAGLTAFFQQRVDEDAIIDYQAAQMIINNSDYPHKNHYLYHDTATDRWRITGWDLDLAFGKVWDGGNSGVYNDGMHNPGVTPWYTTNVRGGGTGNHLLDKFFSQGGTYYRRAYLARLWDALQEKYTLPILNSRIDGYYHDVIFEEQLLDFSAWGRTSPSANDPSAPAAFEPNLQRIKTHWASRRPYLLDYLKNTEGFTGLDRVKITEIMYQPLGSQDAEFIELWNNSGKAIDISGWRIEGIGGGTAVFIFPPQSNLAKDEIFIVARNRTLFTALYGPVAKIYGPFTGNLSNDGESLRVKDDGPGYPATVDFVRYETRGDWPQEPAGLGYSLELTGVHAFRDNDNGASWRTSTAQGGSPGFVEGINFTPQTLFKRGDANGDGQVELSDAVRILLQLFRGAGEPACRKAADADGNGAIEIADALRILIHLFQKGPPPAAPYPACGADAAPDALDCGAHDPCN